MNFYIFRVTFAVWLLLLALTGLGADPDRFSAVTDIRQLWEDPTCEALLRRTYVDACNAIDGSKFSEVLPRAAAFTILVWAPPRGTDFRLTLKKDIVLVKGGPSHTLFVDVGKNVDGTAYCLAARLRTEFEKGASPGMGGIIYPEHSLVAEVLNTMHFKRKLKKDSCVVSIELSFGKISNSGSLEKGMGYTAAIDLERRDKTGRLVEPRGFLYQALSGVDAVENIVKGNLSLSPGDSVFRSEVLEGMSRITAPGASPAIWALE